MNKRFSLITLAELDAKAGQPVVVGKKHVPLLKQREPLVPDGARLPGRLMRSPEDATQAFWMKVAITEPNACWEWQGGRRKEGYGAFSMWTGERVIGCPASRIAYQLVYGFLESSVHVLHRCDNPPCCNPRHLFPGNNRINMIDCVLKRRKKSVILLPEQVMAIRKRLSQGDSRRTLAIEFAVTYWTICDIAQGRRWAFLLAQ